MLTISKKAIISSVCSSECVRLLENYWLSSPWAVHSTHSTQFRVKQLSAPYLVISSYAKTLINRKRLDWVLIYYFEWFQELKQKFNWYLKHCSIPVPKLFVRALYGRSHRSLADSVLAYNTNCSNLNTRPDILGKHITSNDFLPAVYWQKLWEWIKLQWRAFETVIRGRH